MNKKILALALLLIGSQPMHALTKKQVAKRAAVVGLMAGAGAYWAVAQNMFGKMVWPIKLKDGEVDSFLSHLECPDFNKEAQGPAIVGLSALAGMSSLTAWVLSHWTANSRYKWAQKQFAQLEKRSLYWERMNPANISGILQYSGCEYKELPLVEAFNRLRSYDKTLRNIKEQLTKALNDVDRHSELGRKLRKLSRQADYDLARVRANETFIKNHDKNTWLAQWKIYQQQKLERERMIRQQTLAYTQPRFHGHVVYHLR